MSSFDVSSELDWQNLDNAVQQTLKEVGTRYDFKNIKIEITFDRKEKTLTMWCADAAKFSALREVFENKLTKRGLSLMSFDFGKEEKATGMSVRTLVKIQAGISKEKGKEIVASLKDSKIKVQAQIQDEQVRVSSKSKDALQEAMAYLREKQHELKVPIQFGNFRD
jgi:uncharacterized protein YajQ (UPF0234 family)